MSAPGPLRHEIVRDPARFEALAPAWTALWTEADGSVFQSHGWIAAWLGHPAGRPGAVSLHVALAWRGEALAAVMPLAVRRWRGLRVLEWAAKECSDSCDALVAPDLDPAATLAPLWRAAVAAGRFDLAYLSLLAPGAVMREAVRESGPVGRSLVLGRRSAANLRVRGNWPDGGAWFDSLSKKPRQNYHRGRKAVDGTGLVFRQVGDAEARGPFLDALVALKREWLARTGQRSSLIADGPESLRALVEVLHRLGRLRLFVLEHEGRLVAGSVNYVEGGRMMAFFATYDPAYERASPGMVLMVDYIRWAFDRGLEEVDFLTGAEEYKRRFANVDATLACAVAARTWRGRLALLADRARDVVSAWQAARHAARTTARTPPVPVRRPAKA